MAEIKKTLAILKARWPEVALIIGLNILSVFFNKLFRTAGPDSMSMLFLIPIVFLLLLMVVSTMLRLGFLRTVYLQGQTRQLPLVLLKIGKHFFWRMVGLGLLYMIAYFILAWLIFLIVKQLISIDTTFFQTAKVARLAYQLFFVPAMLILIKPVLLMPALIVVLDCGILKSFKLLKQCKLLDAKELVILFFVPMALTFLWAFLPKLNGVETTSQYILTIVPTVINYFIWLMIAVTAVRFVASLNLVYDRDRSSSDSEGFTKEQFNSSMED